MGDHFCVACNACCDGSMFDRVTITPADLARMPDHRAVERDEAEGYAFFKQSCAHLGADGRCGCYADRPTRCRSYDCLLSQRVLAGGTTHADAHAVVAEMKRLRADFVAACRAHVPDRFWPKAEYGARGAFCAMRDAFDAGVGFPTSVRDALFTRWFAYLDVVRNHFDEGFADKSAVAARYAAQRELRALEDAAG
ncbi:MAG: YkgJ family cysteine cluster protein [Pseudomonadota bacterium]